MQYFLLEKPTAMELRRLMDYHEYLQVTILADITSVDGKKMCPNHGTVYSTNVKYILCHDRGSPQEKPSTGNYGNTH